MDTKHLLSIKYLYYSAGLFVEGQRVSNKLWKIALDSENELFCLVNLKYAFCEFIAF